MEHLPIYIPAVFMLTTLAALGLVYKAAGYSKFVLLMLFTWLVLQAAVGLLGFYKISSGTPPRFALLLAPPLLLLLFQLLRRKGRRLLDSFDAKTLTLMQAVRIPVELVLYWLFLHKAVPQIMTFEGRNFDILAGLTAPLIWYLGYVKGKLSKAVLLGWNIACLMLLANIVVTAVLSAPFSFQKFGFGQPNVALFYFPYVWLPCFVVPAALFGHVVSIRSLIWKK